MNLPLPSVAVFDFDHTLIEGDSFIALLRLACGVRRVTMAGLEGLARVALRRFGSAEAPSVDSRTFLKAFMLRRLVAGQDAAMLAPAIVQLRDRLRWKPEIRKALMNHKARGRRIVIASGGLGLYLPALLGDLPYDALICTEIAVENGLLTDKMPQGNCVRERKAELVAAWLAANGPFGESWGYGNLPHDLPMLGLVKHRIIV